MFFKFSGEEEVVLGLVFWEHFMDCHFFLFDELVDQYPREDNRINRRGIKFKMFSIKPQNKIPFTYLKYYTKWNLCLTTKSNSIFIGRNFLWSLDPKK
jgi:hypothetical protein